MFPNKQILYDYAESCAILCSSANYESSLRNAISTRSSILARISQTSCAMPCVRGCTCGVWHAWLVRGAQRQHGLAFVENLVSVIKKNGGCAKASFTRLFCVATCGVEVGAVWVHCRVPSGLGLSFFGHGVQKLPILKNCGTKITSGLEEIRQSCLRACIKSGGCSRHLYSAVYEAYIDPSI